MSFKWLLIGLLVLAGLLVYYHDQIPVLNGPADNDLDQLQEKPKHRGEPSTDPNSK